MSELLGIEMVSEDEPEAIFDLPLTQEIGRAAIPEAAKEIYFTKINSNQLVIPRYAYPFSTEAHYEE